MMERKYRQRGYMDGDREWPAPESGSGAPGRPDKKSPESRSYPIGPKTPVMPGKRTVARCAGCGTILPDGFDTQGNCPRCGFEVHSCKQCAYFDTSSRFECTRPIPVRIPRKDARNDCTFYALRMTIERETSTPRPMDARQAFENLFKKL